MRENGSTGQQAMIGTNTDAASGTKQDGTADGALAEIVGGSTNNSRPESWPSGALACATYNSLLDALPHTP